MTDTAALATPTALNDIEPLATATAHTADGTFTIRIYPGVTPDRITEVITLDGNADGEPTGTTLEDETAQEYADYRAATYLRVRGPAN